MSEIFILIIFGHIVGDYLAQPSWMATKKGSSDFVCLVHCAIVTLFSLIFVTIDWRWGVFTFISHFTIDRFSLADKYLKLIGGRALTEFFMNGHLNIVTNDSFFEDSKEKLKWEQAEKRIHAEISERKMNYRILRGAFSGIVYVIVDASFHLIPAYYFYKYFIL